MNLLWLTGISGGATATYVYDGDGKLVKKTIAGTTTALIGNYYELAGGTAKKHYYAGDVRIAVREGESNLYWLLTDHLGSTAVTTWSGGSRNAEVRYMPFGLDRYEYGAQKTDYRFTGQRIEDSLDLYFYNARWYDPVIGRFLQSDTIVPEPGNPQSLNRYTYVENNPLNHIDPTGHCAPDDEACLAALAEIQQTFGVVIDDSNQMWNIDALRAIRKGMEDLARAMKGGLRQFRELFGNTRFARVDKWTLSGQSFTPAYHDGKGTIYFTNDAFEEYWLSDAHSTTVHELAHVWDDRCDDCMSRGMLAETGSVQLPKMLLGLIKLSPIGEYHPRPVDEKFDHTPTEYARTNRREDWAESLKVTVYPEYIETWKGHILGPERSRYVQKALAYPTTWPTPWK